MEARAEALVGLVRRSRPCAVRQAFYQATIRGLVPNSEAGYAKAQRLLAELRWSGRIPCGWVADDLDRRHEPVGHAGPAEAAAHAARGYRRAVWAGLDARVEVWLEKEALAGALLPVSSRYGVPLLVVGGGYAGLSGLLEAAAGVREAGKRVIVLYLGDHAVGGRDPAARTESMLRDLAPGVELAFRRIAVTQRQVERWALPGRPRGGGGGVELEAIEAGLLRAVCAAWVERLLPEGRLDRLAALEARERRVLASWAGSLARRAGP
jgi:hypothetical protein